MQTLSQKYKAVYEDFKKRGYENIAAMMEVMGRSSEIDKALGYSKAASHWMIRKNTPSWASERKAGDWVSENMDTPESPLERYSSAAIEFQVTQPIVAEDNDTFLAIIPAEKRTKAFKLMTLIGVELVEV